MAEISTVEKTSPTGSTFFNQHVHNIRSYLGSTAPETVVKHLYHEIGLKPEDRSLEWEYLVPANNPTAVEVTVKSHVTTNAVQKLTSPAYLASVRRRSAKRIAHLISGLAEVAQSDSFVLYTHECLEGLRHLINQLSEAEQYSDQEHEGNSCEILRQVRDTLLDNGWERYRNEAVRLAAARVLNRLATQDEVSGEDTYQTMDELLELHLNPAVGFRMENGEDEIPD